MPADERRKIASGDDREAEHALYGRRGDARRGHRSARWLARAGA